jgi:hypothetical protein
MLTTGGINNFSQDNEFLPPRQYYTTALALQAVTEMKKEKTTKEIHPYKKKALDTFYKKILKFCTKPFGYADSGFPKGLNEELLYLIDIDKFVLSFTKTYHIFKYTDPSKNLLYQAGSLVKEINLLYQSYCMEPRISISPILKEKLLRFHQEALDLRMLAVLHSGLKQIANTFKTSKHATILNGIIKEGLDSKNILDTKTAYDKLVMLTTAFKDLVQRDYEKSSFFSYANNTLWNKNLSIANCLEETLKNADSLEPLNKSYIEAKGICKR